MTNKPTPPPPGFPGGFIPIFGTVQPDGRVVLHRPLPKPKP